MFQNGPIRKVITKKVIFEDFLIFSPAVGHPGLTLRKILEDFFKKSQVRNSHYLLDNMCRQTAGNWIFFFSVSFSTECKMSSFDLNIDPNKGDTPSKKSFKL